jgi:hypothetical protein
MSAFFFLDRVLLCNPDVELAILPQSSKCWIAGVSHPTQIYNLHLPIADTPVHSRLSFCHCCIPSSYTEHGSQ